MVQSHRGLIERMFARLKKWEVLFDGLVNSADTWEMELDCAMALQNLLEMERLNLLDMIPARPHFAPGSHIITPNLAPSMKWPKPLSWNHVKMPVHLKDFYRDMSTIAPKLRTIVLQLPGGVKFSPSVMKRGEAKFLGGNVLQVQVQKTPADQWWVRFSVGASMKAPTYKCYCILDANTGLIDQICECKNGLVFLKHCQQVLCHLSYVLYERNGLCGDLNAGLRMLCHWFYDQKNVCVVSKCMGWILVLLF